MKEHITAVEESTDMCIGMVTANSEACVGEVDSE